MATLTLSPSVPRAAGFGEKGKGHSGGECLQPTRGIGHTHLLCHTRLKGTLFSAQDFYAKSRPRGQAVHFPHELGVIDSALPAEACP